MPLQIPEKKIRVCHISKHQLELHNRVFSCYVLLCLCVISGKATVFQNLLYFGVSVPIFFNINFNDVCFFNIKIQCGFVLNKYVKCNY